VRALITGITGFAGSHLADHLLTLGDYDVHGVAYPGTGTANVDGILHRIRLYCGDVTHAPWIAEVLETVRPDVIFHLAAQAAVPLSFKNPGTTLTNNIIGQVVLFEAIRHLGLNPVVLVVGSNEEYGLVYPSELPFREEQPFRPLSPYAVSKITQDMLGYQYFLTYGLRCVRVRPFNHTGPRQAPAFAVPAFAQQIAEAEVGIRPPRIEVGNLSAARDFTDVRDMTAAYVLAVTRGTPGDVYNIGSGHAVPMHLILDMLLSMRQIPLQVVTDPERFRPSDVPVMYCDATKFRQAT